MLMNYLRISLSFGLPKGSKTQKMTFLPPFAPTGSSVGRLDFGRGKWMPNPEIPLGLESRQAGISNELS